MSKQFNIGIAIGSSINANTSSNIKRVSNQTRELGKTLRETNKRLGSVRDAQKYRKTLGELQAKQRAVGGSSKKLAAGIRDVESRYKTAKRAAKSYGYEVKDLAKVERGLARQQAKQSKLMEKLKRQREGGGSRVGAAMGFARGFLGAGVAAGGAVLGFANNFGGRANAIAKTSDKLGFGIEALQEYHYAAERAAISQETFNMASQRSVRRIAEAAQGTGEAIGALEELGLDAAWLAQLAPEQQLAEIADAMQGVTSDGDRVRLAMKLFDSEGVSMVNMLSNGSAGLREMRQEARDTGAILNESAVRGGEKFADTMLDAKMAVGAIANQIGSVLLPVVTEALIGFSSFVKENGPQLRAFGQVVGVVFGFIGKVVKRLFGNLVRLGEGIGKSLGWIESKTGLISGIGGLLGKATGLGGSVAANPMVKPGSAVAGFSEPAANDPNRADNVMALRARNVYQGGNQSSSSVTSIDAPITVQAAPGMDVNDVAAAVGRELDARQEMAAANHRGRLYD